MVKEKIKSIHGAQKCLIYCAEIHLNNEKLHTVMTIHCNFKTMLILAGLRIFGALCPNRNFYVVDYDTL